MHKLASLGGQRSEQFRRELVRPDRTDLVSSSSDVRVLAEQSAESRINAVPNSGGKVEPLDFLEFAKSFPVADGKPDSGNERPFLHANSLQSSPEDFLKRHTEAIQNKPDNPDSGTTEPLTVTKPDSAVSSTPSPECKALPLGSLLQEPGKKCLADRIVAHLIQQEAHEPNPSLRQDLRQAQICILLAGRGNPNPFVISSYQCYGVHPDKVWSRITAERKYRLGKEYSDWYDAAGNLKPDLPKKDSAPVTEIPKKGKRA